MSDFNNFSISSNETSPLISSYAFILKPQLGEKLLNVRPAETDLGMFMKAGLMKKAEGEPVIHQEANKIFDAPYLNTSATVGNVYGVTGASVTADGITVASGTNYIQLAAQSHSPASGANAGKYSLPRVGKLIQFKNQSTWRIIAKDSSTPNAHKLYLTLVTAATAPYNASLANSISNNGGTYGGDQIIVFADAWEEATKGQQKGLVPSFTNYETHFQSFSERYDVTDWASQSKTYPLTYDGKKMNFVYIKGMDDMEKRFMASEEVGLFLTPKDDGNLVDFDGRPVTTTQGFLPTMELQAQKLYYGSAPSLDIFDSIIRLKKKLYQDGDSLVHYGYEFGLKVKDMISNFGKDGAMVYNRQSIDLGFNTISYAGQTFSMRELKILGHADLVSPSGFEYPHYFVVAPTAKMLDTRSNDMKDPFCILYKEMEGKGARGHYKLWETGGNSDAGTNEQLIRTVTMASRKGCQVFGGSRFILGKRS